MKRGLLLLSLGFCCLLASAPLSAQAPASPQTAPAPKPAEANPFPEDTSNVPVMPSKVAPALPEGTSNDTSSDNSSAGFNPAAPTLPGDDLDPVRSPDDARPDATTADESSSSSSLAGLDKLLPRPDEDDKPDKHRKLTAKEPTHQETAGKDVEVGGYYLEKKNWKAAESRFQSAMVLDPENPEVYWGLAEAARHLGNFADARANYQKLLDYDPDGPHGKAARKALKDPEIANAKAAPPPSPSPVDPAKQP
jgi:hypothetical protein